MATFRPPAEHPNLAATDPGLLEAVAAGQARLTPAQGLALLTGAPLQSLGRFADARARVIHGDDIRTYVIDRNINYTNVCSAKCTFCAFRRDADDHDAYTLDPSAIHDKVAELEAIGGTQILMQGGMNPALPLEWYVKLLSGLKSRFPKIHIHAFSPPEFIEFVHFFDPPGATLEDKLRWVMIRLRDAGLDSVPGGGGEIFSHHVRRKIGLGKCDADAWLTTMYVAHTLGMFTSATMMFGHIEGYADRVHHMLLYRQWQDKALALGASGFTPEACARRTYSAPGHYKAFISWPFQRENTPLGRLKDWGAEEGEWEREFPGDVVARAQAFGAHDEVDYRELGPDAELFGRRVRMSGAIDYLRTQAVSRLMLDNIYSIGASWVTMGPHVGQIALMYGANDMGSVMMEENVVSSAGTFELITLGEIERQITSAGFVPRRRNFFYEITDPRGPIGAAKGAVA